MYNTYKSIISLALVLIIVILVVFLEAKEPNPQKDDGSQLVNLKTLGQWCLENGFIEPPTQDKG